MTTYDDLDSTPAGADLATLRLYADLERACAVTMPVQRRADVARRLGLAAQPASPGHLRLARDMRRVNGNYQAWHAPLRTRVASIAAAAIILLAGTLGYLHLRGLTHVSAAELLHRAAHAVGDIPSNGVVHEITRLHTTPQQGSDITFEQWSQLGANGNPVRVDLRAISPNSALDETTIADSQGNLWTISGTAKQVTQSRWTPGTALFGGPTRSEPQSILFLPKEVIYAPQDPSAMRQLLLSASQGSDAQTRLLPHQTIDGRTVDVIEVTRTMPASTSIPPQGVVTNILTISIDDATYQVRRIDWRGVNGSGATVQDQLFDITTYDIVPLTAVPPGTFSFTPPPGTQVCHLTGQLSACPPVLIH